MIYISTGGFGQLPFYKTVENLSAGGLASFELSGGQFCDDIESYLRDVAVKHNITLHNYFPPAQIPFVFNLASLDAEIAERSLLHAKHVIDLSSMIRANYYSFHAGYLIDPKVDELGRKIKNRELNDRDKSLHLFIERVNELSAYAQTKKVRLLIENNVLSYENYMQFKNNPLLMVDQPETESIMRQTNDNVGLLIDVAHLKVSATTLGFSKEKYLSDFFDTAEAYHFSDNQGLEDSNHPVDEVAWFWSLVNPNLDYYSLEIYNASVDLLTQQYNLTKEIIEKYASQS